MCGGTELTLEEALPCKRYTVYRFFVWLLIYSLAADLSYFLGNFSLNILHPINKFTHILLVSTWSVNLLFKNSYLIIYYLKLNI